jgi:tRNA A-37 threonylcarbamoyl transferase component Bud32
MHSKGWVHNDVKTPNFIASAESAGSSAPPVFVIDLGFAKRTAGEVQAGTAASATAA